MLPAAALVLLPPTILLPAAALAHTALTRFTLTGIVNAARQHRFSCAIFVYRGSIVQGPLLLPSIEGFIHVKGLLAKMVDFYGY
jgi:hypothetical protein